MKIEIIHKDSGYAEQFQLFCEKNALVFNSKKWLDVYEASQIQSCAIFNKNNDVIGCFVYYIFKKSSFKFIITPPYAPHIELFYVNPAESIVGKNTFDKEISEALAVYFKSLSYDYFNINLPINIVDTQPFIWQKFQSRNRFTYLIDLSLSEEQLWNNLSSEKRKSIKKAEKDGLLIEISEDKKRIYDLVLKSLNRNEKNKNANIIKNILTEFASNSNSYAFTARLGQDYLATAFCIQYGGKSMYLFGGFDDQNKHHGAHVSCMWQCILKAKKQGLVYFDFEGSMNKSIERYFREFGGELKSYSCIEDVKPTVALLLKLKGGLPI
ncbi:MAG: GNAT family N-acetyltransferase [Bacteroidota bacterium]